MNILVIGNSHTAAFKKGHDLSVDKIPHGIKFRISGVGNPKLEKWKLVDSVVFPFKDRRSGDDTPYPIDIYDLLVIFAGHSVSDPRLLYEKKFQYLSDSILTEIAKSCEDPRFQHSKHSPIIKSFLSNSECSKDILIVGSPYPSFSIYEKFLAEVPLNSITPANQKLYRSLNSGTKEYCSRIHKKNCSSLKSICDSLNLKNPKIKYYFPPLEVLDETSLFTKKDLMIDDGNHGNEKYGEIIFTDILSRISENF